MESQNQLTLHQRGFFFSRIDCFKKVVICGDSDSGTDSLTKLDETPARGLDKFIYLLNILKTFRKIYNSKGSNPTAGFLVITWQINDTEGYNKQPNMYVYTSIPFCHTKNKNKYPIWRFKILCHWKPAQTPVQNAWEQKYSFWFHKSGCSGNLSTDHRPCLYGCCQIPRPQFVSCFHKVTP